MGPLLIRLDTKLHLGVVAQICWNAKSSSRLSKWTLLVINHGTPFELFRAFLAIDHVLERFVLEVLQILLNLAFFELLIFELSESFVLLP